MELNRERERAVLCCVFDEPFLKRFFKVIPDPRQQLRRGKAGPLRVQQADKHSENANFIGRMKAKRNLQLRIPGSIREALFEPESFRITIVSFLILGIVISGTRSKF